jgi:hypothetical protein
MAEEHDSQTVAAAAEPTATPPEAGPAGHDARAQPAADEHLESCTREMLRKAIQNVMGEIEYHEAEAQKHLKQAAELRKELRDSLKFLQEQARKAQPSVVYEESPSAGNSEPSVGKERPAANRPARRGRKKSRLQRTPRKNKQPD